jgi:hypothetical protein
MLTYLVSSEHAAQKFEGFFSGPLKALELHDDVESIRGINQFGVGTLSSNTKQYNTISNDGHLDR